MRRPDGRSILYVHRWPYVDPRCERKSGAHAEGQACHFSSWHSLTLEAPTSIIEPLARAGALHRHL